MSTHCTAQQRVYGVKDNPYQSSGIGTDSGKILPNAADAEPVPEEEYGCEQESVEYRVGSHKLWSARTVAGAAHANVAEYQSQYY